MENSKLIASYPPYVRDEESVEKIMYTVTAALLPAVGASVYFFGPRALALLLVCVLSTAGSEYLFNRARKQGYSFLDGSAVLTGVLLAMNLPSNLPFWMAALGSFFAIVIVKQLFGGLGCNIFNPALAARVFLLISFPVAMTSWPVPFSVDALTAASPLGILKTEGLQAVSSLSLWQAFTGGIGGSFGETSGLALLAGAAVLFWKRYITWIIPFSFIGMVFAFTGAFYLAGPSKYASPLFHMATGGLLLGAFFMATDMVTSPVSKRGQLIFGLGCGLLTGVIRLFGGYPEGASFAILIMNALVPLLDKWDAYADSRKWRAG